MPTITTIQPAIEPVTLQEAKDHLNYTGSLDDSIIDFIIKTARETVENLTGRALITRTLELTTGCFSDVMELSKPTLQSVTSVAYIDTDGATQTLATSIYDVDAKSTPGAVRLGYDQSWPSIRSVYNAVTITYKAGYGDNAQDVPGPLKSAMLLIIGHLYENREATAPISINEVPMSVKFLIAPYRIYNF